METFTTCDALEVRPRRNGKGSILNNLIRVTHTLKCLHITVSITTHLQVIQPSSPYLKLPELLLGLESPPARLNQDDTTQGASITQPLEPAADARLNDDCLCVAQPPSELTTAEHATGNTLNELDGCPCLLVSLTSGVSSECCLYCSRGLCLA